MLFKQTIQEYLSTMETTKSAQKKEREKTESILSILEEAFVKDIQVKHSVTEIKIEDLISKEEYRDRFKRKIMDVINSYPRDKENAKKRIESFVEYLKNNYKVDINLSEVLPDVIVSDKLERQLDMLKILHKAGIKNREIADYYNISWVTASNDLSDLLDGISFMGQKIKIECYKNEEYLSTVHPIFLPLNLSEVSALTIGLKKLSKGSILEETYSYLADYIFSQLSEYGKQKIRDSAAHERIYFNGDYFEDEPGYRVEKSLLEHGREEKLLYLMKSGSECEISYWDDEGEKSVIGKIGWDSTISMDKTVIAKTKDDEIKIDAKRIIDIKIKNYR